MSFFINQFYWFVCQRRKIVANYLYSRFLCQLFFSGVTTKNQFYQVVYQFLSDTLLFSYLFQNAYYNYVEYALGQ